jgi:hypothetical protein
LQGKPQVFAAEERRTAQEQLPSLRTEFNFPARLLRYQIFGERFDFRNVSLAVISDEVGRLMTEVIIWFGSLPSSELNSGLFSGSFEKTIRPKSDPSSLFHLPDLLPSKHYHQP